VTIPVNAEVRAVPNVASCLKAAHAFMVEQDAGSAERRFEKLQAEVVKARGLLAFAPSSGRPARFLDAKTGWGQFHAQQAMQLARALGMPELREVILLRHLLLYAHSERQVVLLSLRHERQLAYRWT
jgi:hypothetical protein